MSKRYLGGGISFEQKDVYQEFSEDDSPSPGGSSTLAGLTDVDIGNPTDGQVLVYDAASEKWVNGSGGGGVLLLDGVYAAGSESTTITMDITAGALMSAYLAGPVRIRYTAVEPEYPDEEITEIDTLVSAFQGSVEGADTYSFTLVSARGEIVVCPSATALDPVVFELIR